MTRLLLPLAALGGCIIYDTDGKCARCGDDGDWYEDTGSLGDDDGDGRGDEDPVEEEVTFSLDPNEAVAGDTFIAGLVVTEGEFDLGTVDSVEFFSGVSVCTSSLREAELLLTLVVDGQALPGEVDMLLHLADGDVVFVEGALTIVDPNADDGSGDGGTGDGGTGGTGDNSGDGGTGGTGDGSGDGGTGGTGDGSGDGGTDGSSGDGC
ncbi:MAG: hypothetical protein ACOZNI_37760 [Myxococcota bacterium]